MLCRNWGFCDLSISNNFDLSKLHQIEKQGYFTVAINTYVEETTEEPKPKRKKGENREKKDMIPPPIQITQELLDSTKLNILQRVTIAFSDPSIVPKLNSSENLKKYDIVAVVPLTRNAFQFACSSMDIDLISFEPENKSPYRINRKMYNQAVERGLFFEVMYSPAIRDSTCRKNIISTSHNYHTIGKSKNIVITSGAENYMHIRDVHDVINLSFILGMNSNQGLEAIRNNARNLILKAEGRRSGKHYVAVNPLNGNRSLN